jgi:hypothetical protein
VSGWEPTDIANQCLDTVGSTEVLGDIEDGSRMANVVLRSYRQCLMQLLRAAHWSFARKQAPMILLADATGQTPNTPTQVPVPFTFEYQYPIDCMKARFVPANPHGLNGIIPQNNIMLPNVPLTTNGIPALAQQRLIPARFLIDVDYNYPPPPGQITWEVQGVSPVSQTVILTNVKHAILVYTALMLYPSQWDSLFRAAMVAYLAAEIALPIWAEKDRKFGLTLRQQQYAIAAQKLQQARATDGNEAGFANTDHTPDWMRTRHSGGGWNRGYSDGPGVLGYGWDTCGFEGGISSSAAF